MEQKKYKVTIGIPVYNAERYISKCLQSVFDQTIDGIELLLIDDKGNDNSMSVAWQMIANNPNGGMARIVEHEKNMGVANARNTIVREAKGKYLFFMDSDDYLAPNSIELLYNKAEETGAETVWGSTLQVDSETGKESVFWSYPDLQLFGEDELINYEYEKEETRLLTVVWNILFHTEFLREKKLVFEQNGTLDDTIFHYNLQPVISKAVLMSDFTYYYYIRPNSISNFQKRDKYDIKEAITTLGAFHCIVNASNKVKQKPYYPLMCLRIMKWSFFKACGLLKHREQMNEPLSDKCIKELFRHPTTLKNILRMDSYRWHNLAFYFLGTLPSKIMVMILCYIAKKKGLL